MRCDCNRVVQFISLAFILSCNPQATTGQKVPPTNTIYTVNFISIGAGTDHEAKGWLAGFLYGFEKNNKGKLDYKIEHWGKEGETKYLFDLSKLSPLQRNKFVNAITERFREDSLVKVDSTRSE